MKVPSYYTRWPRLRQVAFIGMPVLAAIVITILLSTRGGAEGTAPVQQPAAALTVTRATPRVVSWPATFAASGTITPWQESIVGAQVGGLSLVEVRVDVGDVVKRGDVLARLDGDLLRAQQAQLRAALTEAEAAVEEADANSKRASSLRSTGALSEQAIIQYLTAATTARARVESAKAQLASNALELRYTTIIAPDDGVISSRTATLGAVIPAGNELFRFIRQNRLEWRGELTATQMSQVVTGQGIVLNLPDGKTAEARVRQLAPSVSMQSRLGMVYADVVPGSTARAGMYANGLIVTSQSQALVIPATSVIIRDGRSYVVKINTAEPTSGVSLQAVTVGRRVAGDFEILQGLAPTDQVVVAGAGFLNDGDIVRVASVER